MNHRVSRHLAVVCTGIGIVALAAYWRALGVGFFSDDYEWLGRMAATVGRPSYLFSVFYRDFNPGLHLSFLVDWLVGGARASAGVYHATSVLIHALNASLIALLAARMTGNLRAGALGGLFIAVNVRLSEVAIWPAARGHSLAASFLLAAALLLQTPGVRRAALSAAAFVAAILTKEIAIFPLAAMPLPAGFRWPRLLGHAIAAAVFIAVHKLMIPVDYPPIALAEAVLKLPFVLLRPLGLGDYYSFGPVSAALALVAIAAIALLLRRQPAATAGFIWLIACCIAVVPLQKLSSRYLYMLSFGYALILAGAWRQIESSWPRPRRVAGFVAGILGILLAATNLVLIQAEIDDYRQLSLPYEKCIAAFGDAAWSLEPGQTLVVADLSPRRTIIDLNRMNAEGVAMRKLIPMREKGIDGLIMLPDIVNTVRAGAGGLAIGVDAKAAASVRIIYAYDGTRVWPIDDTSSVPADRLFAARLSPPSEYFTGK